MEQFIIRAFESFAPSRFARSKLQPGASAPFADQFAIWQSEKRQFGILPRFMLELESTASAKSLFERSHRLMSRLPRLVPLRSW
eukprot:CAMPEP_0114112892 /NCGR_PEP_ID=MMETSP0043_2-20121206/2624_1 /TAXON_ID=464988 /ORGANISM="Hemiselmis andersenii, Strain CCMP644" /LENGTH=83 /DNA_ID=CAMNT_0001205011 /DNA_START=61 /DNA_END=309 /DNA_ORIENTATION=-